MPATFIHPCFRKAVNTMLFITVVAVSLFSPLFNQHIIIRLVIILLSVLMTIILYFTNYKAFVSALFFAINAVSSPFILHIINKYQLYIPQIYFLIPIIIYLILILTIRKLKQEIAWLKWGKIDKSTFLIMAVMIIITAISLFVWAYFFKADITEKFRKLIPDIPFILLILYGISFPVFNSFFEEFISRAVLYDGFSGIFSHIACVIIFQAAIFALWHYNGFPGGVSGVCMVFFWSVFLGIIRYKSKGMLAPLVAHFFADLTIAVILLFFIILPGKIG